MTDFRRTFRKVLSWSHRWLGFVGGTFICLLAVSGAIITFRTQISNVLSPPAAAGSCVSAVDWNRAQQEVEAFTGTATNRIYAPTAPEMRWRFRMPTGTKSTYTYVIYDACAAKVLGTANLSWMDWLVDLHQNLLAGKTGRWYEGWIGVALLLSGLGGISIWLITYPSVQRLFRIHSGARMPRDLHSTFGVLAGVLLLVASFTSIDFSFPKTMRSAIQMFAPERGEARAPRPKKAPAGTALAGLGDVMRSAAQAIPGGAVREIRMDEKGSAQVRMWLPSDFRGSGNNTVTLDRASAEVTAIELYSARPPANKFTQAMSALHYGDWGGMAYRTVYGIAGLSSALLFVTGILIWWLPRRRRASRPSVRVEQAEEVAVS